jgi:type IV pilus assembly protein PilA
MKKPTLKTTSGSGFSLVELLVVIAVIAIIAAIAIPNIANITSAAETSKSQRNAQNIASVFSAARAAGWSDTVADTPAAIAAVTGSGVTMPAGGAFAGQVFTAGTLSPDEVTAAAAFLNLSGNGTASILQYSQTAAEASPTATPQQ